MSRPRRVLWPLAVLAATLLLQAPSALATLAPIPAHPWATPNGRVLAIVRVNDVVYVGGKFTSIVDTNGVVRTRNHLAAISAVDGHVLPWNPGANNMVRSLAVSNDGGTLYIGGDFTSLGGQARMRLAAEATISPSSTTASGTLRRWAPKADEAVYTIAQLGARVYLGGAFLHVNGQGRPRLASVSASTGRLYGWHPKADGAVRALLPSPTGSVIFAGGLFKHMNDTNNPHLVALNPTTGRLAPWRAYTQHSVMTLAENASYLYAGDKGGGGHVRSYILKNGKMRWTESTDGNVNALALIGSGSSQQLVLGGHFTKVGKYVRHKVAIISPITGLVDASPGAWHPAAAGSDLGVYAVLAYGQHVYFGGDFLEWQTHPGVYEQAHLAAFATTAAADVKAPIVKAPAVTIARGATVGTAKLPLHVAVTASDKGSGVCRVSVRRRFATNAYSSVPLLLAASRSANPSVSPAKKAYTFGARATDCSDNSSAWVSSAPVRVAAFKRTIAYHGSWTARRVATAYGGSARRAGRAGASASLRFTGREVAWVASLAPGYGSARVYVDGHPITTVHLRSSRLVERRVVFVRNWATVGRHTIKIVALGTAGHPTVDVDALLVVH
jgi:trimeric autotransporter adhesin